MFCFMFDIEKIDLQRGLLPKLVFYNSCLFVDYIFHFSHKLPKLALHFMSVWLIKIILNKIFWSVTQFSSCLFTKHLFTLTEFFSQMATLYFLLEKQVVLIAAFLLLCLCLFLVVSGCTKCRTRRMTTSARHCKVLKCSLTS